MNKAIIILSLMVVVLFAACNDDTPKPPPGPPEMAQRTVIAYQIADNSLSDLLYGDFQEMIRGMQSVDDRNNNFLVYSDSKNDVPYLIYLQKDGTGNVVADTVRRFPEQNPLEKQVMKSVLIYVIEEYPAQDYGLIIASHGEGWLPSPNSPNLINPRWIGDHQGSYMNIADLHDVLTELPRLNFLFFDACYMQAIEVLYELRDCADYIISSPTEIPGVGAPYQEVVPLMFSNKQDVAIDIAGSYFEYYNERYSKSGNEWKYGVSVSVIKTAELDNFAAMTRSVIQEYVKQKQEIPVLDVLHYDGSRQYYFDMDGIIQLITGGNSDYQQWATALDSAQPFFKTTPQNLANNKGGSFDMTKACGVSMYVPRNRYASNINVFYQTLSWYSAGGWKDSGW